MSVVCRFTTPKVTSHMAMFMWFLNAASILTRKKKRLRPGILEHSDRVIVMGYRQNKDGDMASVGLLGLKIKSAW